MSKTLTFMSQKNAVKITLLLITVYLNDLKHIILHLYYCINDIYLVFHQF
uniref:Uncharacterized protein n=1 Tax=Anguilla anguilla TaxID=7936 RepID=A0A0E9VH98_ANGAN